MRAQNTNLLQVQLTEAEKRHIKALAASQGVTLRQATLRAFAAWESVLRSARSAPRGADSKKSRPANRAAVSGQDRQTAEGKPSLTEDGSEALSRAAAARDWLGRAAQLDWSKCPEAEKGPGKKGNVWVVRGTDALVAHVLESVGEGHPFMEIAEVFEITLPQLIAVLQYAVEGLTAGGFTTEAQRTRS